MCDRCEAMDALGAQVEAAVADESVPRVCSVPGCEQVPVARVAASADQVDLLCVGCLVRLVAVGAVRDTAAVFCHAGVHLVEESQLALAQVVSARLMSVTEVL